MLIITFKYRYRKQIVIGIFILFLLVGGTILRIFMCQSDKKDKMIDITENTYKYNLLEVMDYFNIDLKKSEDDKPKIKRM